MLKDNLVMLRNIRGLSQEETASKIGISRQAYSKWESGATVPDIEKCMELAGFYGVTLDSLVKTSEVNGMSIPPAPAGKNIWGTVTVNERGQIVIPKAAREKFGITGGSRLVILSNEMGIAMITAEQFEETMRRAMEFAASPAEL